MNQEQTISAEQVLHELRHWALAKISRIPPEELLKKINELDREIKGPPKPPEGRGHLIIVSKSHYFHNMAAVEWAMRNRVIAKYYDIIDLSKINR